MSVKAKRKRVHHRTSGFGEGGTLTIPGRRLVLEAQAHEELLVAANAALAELRRLDGLAANRARPGAYLGLKNARSASTRWTKGGSGAGRGPRRGDEGRT